MPRCDFCQVLLACVGVLFFPGQNAQPVFALLVTSVYAMMTIKVNPYLLDSNDFSASFTNIGLWITAFYSLLSKTEVNNNMTRCRQIYSRST